jgi:hypothetical protein
MSPYLRFCCEQHGAVPSARTFVTVTFAIALIVGCTDHDELTAPSGSASPRDAGCSDDSDCETVAPGCPAQDPGYGAYCTPLGTACEYHHDAGSETCTRLVCATTFDAGASVGRWEATDCRQPDGG